MKHGLDKSLRWNAWKYLGVEPMHIFLKMREENSIPSQKNCVIMGKTLQMVTDCMTRFNRRGQIQWNQKKSYNHNWRAKEDHQNYIDQLSDPDSEEPDTDYEIFWGIYRMEKLSKRKKIPRLLCNLFKPDNSQRTHYIQRSSVDPQ